MNNVENSIASIIEAIDFRLGEIEQELKGYENLKSEREQLLEKKKFFELGLSGDFSAKKIGGTRIDHESKILEALVAAPTEGLTATEIATAYGTISSNITHALCKLVKANKIEKTADCKYRLVAPQAEVQSTAVA